MLLWLWLLEELRLLLDELLLVELLERLFPKERMGLLLFPMLRLGLVLFFGVVVLLELLLPKLRLVGALLLPILRFSF